MFLVSLGQSHLKNEGKNFNHLIFLQAQGISWANVLFLEREPLALFSSNHLSQSVCNPRISLEYLVYLGRQQNKLKWKVFIYF
jgi:hypothetical protein